MTFKVPGIILNVDRNTLRTPAVIVDALLGQGEALDCYSMKIQDEVVRDKQFANQAKEKALAILDSITDPVAKAEAFAKMLNPITTQIIKTV
jgi:hypothetical protein